jgi:hypothetical protein
MRHTHILDESFGISKEKLFEAHPQCIACKAENAKPIATENRKSFLHGVFTTALEGGIGYWSVTDEYHWSSKEPTPSGGYIVNDDIDGFYAVIESNEDDWGVSHAWISEVSSASMMDITATQSLRVDRSVIERGVNMLVDNVIAATKSEDASAPFSREYLRQFVVAWLTDSEDGDYDSEVADMVVQLGLFGEVVYG